MYRFHQAEGLTAFLIDVPCVNLEALDAAAKMAYRNLPMDASCYYKCDIYKDGKIIDRFDLSPSHGSGVDDLGRTPSQMLKAHHLI